MAASFFEFKLKDCNLNYERISNMDDRYSRVIK